MEQDNKKPEGFRGKKNIYVCEKCHGHIVTVDKDEGVTPFLVGCQATYGCDGLMRSSMYRVFDQSIGALHEWYKPTAIEVLSPAVAAHVAQGGLVLRKLDKRSA